MPDLISQTDDEPVAIDLSRETLAQIVLHARAFDVQTASTDEGSGSNGADDQMIDVLQDGPDNAMGAELRAAIVSLPDDRRAALVALTWVGRGDYDRAEWAEALSMAKERANGATARYLMGLPMLGDLIAQGAEELGIDLLHEEQIALHHPVTEEPSENDRD